ncbi:cytochrome c [Rasiella rasia]|uniref:Cytochrome c n=1 Tax=Rasiella rasia TaxID=2744027 RepID=A0A6G6GHT5_9FLAO|nr:cytochrome c [Rasiella rasia]QIE58077.1 cytochrome c [Rasiella rasia]
MKKTILISITALTIFACKNSEKKERIKIGSVQVSENTQQKTPLQESLDRGGLVYTDFCMQCHLANGAGIPGNFPPLANSNWLTDKLEESIRGVKYGQSGEIVVNGVTYNGVMAPMGLSNQEVADVMNYVMNNWGNTQETMLTEADVAKIEE